MDIPGSISAITAALGIVKEIRAIDAQFDKAELKLKVAGLSEALSEAKAGLVDVAEQLRGKDEEIARLKALISFKTEKLVDRGQFRYFADENGNAKGAPLCPPCERKGTFLAVVQDRSKGAGGITYYCPQCKANYGPHVSFAR